MKKIKSKKKTTVSIKFDNVETAKYFMEWLSNIGEQDYWLSQNVCEEKEEGNITAVDFDYDFKKFKIKTTSGRLTDNALNDLDESRDLSSNELEDINGIDE